MASTARMIMTRGLNSATGVVQAQTNGTSNNETLALISSLVFAESKSVRTSTIILAAFNVLAASTTVASILYDCYWASKRCNPKFKASKFCVSSIHPAETFPLILAIGIVIQGLVFAAVQGTGLKSLFTTGCKVTAQFMWPALFIIPYIQLVFGLECALRALRKIPFQARGKYDVTICGGVIVVMLIGTWIPSHIFEEPHKCFASLVWFISRYGTLGLLILSIVAGLMVASALTIFIRLSSVTMIDQHQRIAASRMVYYLVLGIVSLAFVIPYFVSQMDRKQGDLKVAMMATVVLNLSGLMSGLLQLFLRSNTATTSFGPKKGRHWDRSKHEIRIWGPNELAFGDHLVDPVSGPRSPESSRERSESRTSLVGVEKISMESLQSPPFRSSKWNSPSTPNRAELQGTSTAPTIPEPAKELPGQSPDVKHTRKQSYSLFPSELTTSPARQELASVYDITSLAPPPPLHFSSKGHKRDSSVISSATVQIGLRLSQAPEPSEEDLNTLPLPSTTYDPTSTSKSAAPSSSPFLVPQSIPTARSKSPSPLQLQIPEPPIRSPLRPSPLANTTTRGPEHSPTRAAVDKDLPPTPGLQLATGLENLKLRESKTQLSPAVYSPEKEKKAMVGLPLGSKPSPLRGNPAQAPQRSNSGRIIQQDQRKQQGKEWI